MNQEEKFSRIVDLMSIPEPTTGQAAELDSLLDTDELRTVLRDMDNGEDVVRRLERYGQYSHEEAFRKFRQAARITLRRRILRRAAVGAAAAVLVTGGVWLVREGGSPSHDIAPATRQAVLISGDNHQIALSERDTTITIAGSNAMIQSGEILFDAEEAIEATATWNRIVVPRGGVYTVRLNDGTRVMLNADSELGFPSSFSDDKRAVTIRGEGYFEVAPDLERPFTVHTIDDLDIKVLGTKFNVQAYDEFSQTQVTLVEGSVGVSGAGHNVTLHPREQAVFDSSAGTLHVIQPGNVATSTAWTRGWFDFDAVSMDVIIATLEKWYDVEIETSGVDLDELGRFSMYLSQRDDVGQLLDIMRRTTGLSYRIEGRTIYLFF